MHCNTLQCTAPLAIPRELSWSLSRWFNNLWYTAVHCKIWEELFCTHTHTHTHTNTQHTLTNTLSHTHTKDTHKHTHTHTHTQTAAEGGDPHLLHTVIEWGHITTQTCVQWVMLYVACTEYERQRAHEPEPRYWFRCRRNTLILAPWCQWNQCRGSRSWMPSTVVSVCVSRGVCVGRGGGGGRMGAPIKTPSFLCVWNLD